MGGERILIRGQDATFGESGNDCCLSIVISVGGSYTNLTGTQEQLEIVNLPEDIIEIW